MNEYDLQNIQIIKQTDNDSRHTQTANPGYELTAAYHVDPVLAQTY